VCNNAVIAAFSAKPLHDFDTELEKFMTFLFKAGQLNIVDSLCTVRVTPQCYYAGAARCGIRNTFARRCSSWLQPF